jgi:hypothetical protein
LVSSAAHLKNKRLVSSEELTNTDMVFNATFEIFKIAGDQSTISGVTQPVFHGFNYSPKEAPFPGWITYGCYFNDKNNIGPYFKHYTDYRSRLSALLQQATMFADIALLAPFPDMWSIYGAQNEPFPTLVYPAYQMLIWEAIHQNGNACDYVSESVLNDSEMKDGFIKYGKRKYHTLFLIEVKSITTSTAKKLYDFVANGGRIICVEAFPEKSLGWKDYEKNDLAVKNWVNKMKAYPDRFIFLNKPENDFIQWYQRIQEAYKITPYVKIKSPKKFVSQVRYQADNAEIIMFTNSSDEQSYDLNLGFENQITRRKQAWLWDAVTGERFRLKIDNGNLNISLRPAEAKIIVFDKEKKGKEWKELPLSLPSAKILNNKWQVKFEHTDGTESTDEFSTLSDLKDIEKYRFFSGNVIYKNSFIADDKNKTNYLNLGKVYGISDVTINGKNAGVQWYGARVLEIGDLLKTGENSIEIKVVTVMGN